jgi:hypothetical protein
MRNSLLAAAFSPYDCVVDAAYRGVFRPAGRSDFPGCLIFALFGHVIGGRTQTD